MLNSWIAKIACAGVSIVLAAFVSAQPVLANCQNTASFERWLNDFKQDAVRSGLSRNVVDNALHGITLDERVIRFDRGQRVFTQSFLEFAGRMVSSYRLTHGRRHLEQQSGLFNRIEREFGVPGPVIVAFWALETDFGANIGNMSTLRSLATLAYDCRRPEKFRPELMAALRIIERGDLTAQQMVSPWAGELGQTQFLPSVYYRYAVDYDGNGRRDLLRSQNDALASTANYLRALGWRAGEPWLEEVRVPSQMAWEEADVTKQHPRTFWARQGVTRRDGSPLTQDNVPASLILPMGRNGPAFLAYRNFLIYIEWNNSLIYATTAAYLATRLAGAPRVSPGRAEVPVLGYEQMLELQRLLSRLGYDVGGIDGILGENTRRAVRQVQIRLGMPADSYPSPELLQRLRAIR